jgi:STE24 endopeptidase
MWAAILWLAWSVLLTRVAPMWLIPIFYRQRPLADAELRRRLEALVARCRTRVQGIFEVNLSKTTRKANACLCGLGATRRVLVSDTLLSSHPPEEVEVVLAHEVGHHRLNHLWLLIVVSALQIGISCFLVDLAAPIGMARLSLTGLDDLAVLPLLGLGLLLANLALMPGVNAVSRWLEAQADRFALERTGNPQAFIATMHRLAERNLAEMVPPRWAEWLLYDHPPISQRIASAEKFQRAL